MISREGLLASPNTKDLPWLILTLVVISSISWLGIHDKSLTVDELVHVVAGDAAWSLIDFRINPENGNLPSRISALPLQFLEEKPIIDTKSLEWTVSSQWELSSRWWFDSGGNPHRLLRLARLSMLAFNLLGIVLLFLISGSQWGRGGAWLSLFLGGFSPNFLGHAPLATSDFAGAWTFVLAAITFARLVKFPTSTNALLSGLAIGLAMLCKHSAVLIAPVALLLVIWKVLDDCLATDPTSEGNAAARVIRFHIRRTAPAIVLAALSAVLVIWTAYAWRYQAASPDVGEFHHFQIPWTELGASGISPLVSFFRDWQLLPEAYLYGLNYVDFHSDRGGYLNGLYSESGFRFYHVWTFLYKTPPPAIILHIMGSVCFLGYLFRHRGILPSTLKALVLLGSVYGLVLLSSRLAIGHRHAFLLLYISCITSGVIIRQLLNGPYYRTSLAVLGLGLTMVPLAALNHDRFIAYVNPLGGGERAGFRRLADSSLDWGQDLPAAVEYISRYKEANPSNPVYLAYFGKSKPEAHGLSTSTAYLHGTGGWRRKEYHPRLEPGLFVASASIMVPTRSEWTRILESAYLELRSKSAPLYAKLLSHEDYGVKSAESNLSSKELSILKDYEYLRFQRLKMLMLTRQPDEVLNGSILVYKLTSQDLSLF